MVSAGTECQDRNQIQGDAVGKLAASNRRDSPQGLLQYCQEQAEWLVLSSKDKVDEMEWSGGVVGWCGGVVGVDGESAGNNWK